MGCGWGAGVNNPIPKWHHQILLRFRCGGPGGEVQMFPGVGSWPGALLQAPRPKLGSQAAVTHQLPPNSTDFTWADGNKGVWAMEPH